MIIRRNNKWPPKEWQMSWHDPDAFSFLRKEKFVRSFFSSCRPSCFLNSLRFCLRFEGDCSRPVPEATLPSTVSSRWHSDNADSQPRAYRHEGKLRASFCRRKVSSFRLPRPEMCLSETMCFQNCSLEWNPRYCLLLREIRGRVQIVQIATPWRYRYQ